MAFFERAVAFLLLDDCQHFLQGISERAALTLLVLQHVHFPKRAGSSRSSWTVKSYVAAAIHDSPQIQGRSPKLADDSSYLILLEGSPSYTVYLL